MPFGSSAFEAAIAFWSLNHALSVEDCLREIYRVLKRGGQALLVLEDMMPTWRDTAKLFWQEFKARRLRSYPPFETPWHQELIPDARATVRQKLSRHAWPLQNDHLLIEEGDLRRLLRGRFLTRRRSWDGGFLSYELERV
jgi:SAM-dependent methyltransferase